MALVASVAAIALVTLLPVESGSEVRLRPFSEIREAFEPDTGLLIGSILNVLLFVPFGAALCASGLSIRATAVIGLLTSGVVEGAQWAFISGRTTSTDDVLLNTLGALIGYALLSRWTRASTTPDRRLGGPRTDDAAEWRHKSPDEHRIGAARNDERSPAEPREPAVEEE